MMVDAIETYYKDRIHMLKDRIENERLERKIAQQAQQHVFFYNIVNPLIGTGTDEKRTRILQKKGNRAIPAVA